MSRVSIERRIQRVRDAVLPPHSFEWRVDRLSVDLKQAWQSWRRECDSINCASEKKGINRYEQLLSGNDNRPPMPIAVYRALWPHGEVRGEITFEMSVSEAAQLYEAMLNEGAIQ